MAESVTVAAVQMPWKETGDLEEFREHLYRYLRLARTKDAELVVLPELIGIAIVAVLLGQEHRHRKTQQGFLSRLRLSFGGGGSDAGLRSALPEFVSAESETLQSAYLDLFSAAARAHGVWLVGGSLYLRDGGGPVRALCGVFDANGDLRGWQAKLHLADYERALAVPGENLSLFEAPWGRFGVLLGSDLLYPELGRALAYRGAVGIANPAATTRQTDWKRLRIAAMARAQENQIFLAQSFLLGEDELTGSKRSFIGRSSLWAPIELTPRGDAPLVEVGAESAEGVISAEWNVGLLRQLWQNADERPRDQLRGPLFARLLSFDFESGATITERTVEIEARASEQEARAKPLILQSPTYPERTALPVEEPRSPEEFLEDIETEVETVADMDSAREFLAASQPSIPGGGAVQPPEVSPSDRPEEAPGEPGGAPAEPPIAAAAEAETPPAQPEETSGEERPEAGPGVPPDAKRAGGPDEPPGDEAEDESRPAGA